MSLPLKHGTLADTEEWIDRPLPPVVGVDAATRDAARRKLEAQEFDCPLHTDEDVARELGFDDVVMPATLLRPLAATAYWSPGDEQRDAPYVPGPAVLRHVPGPGDRVVATEVDTTYHAPVLPGDRIVTTSTLREVIPKETSIGAGAFLVVETEYRKVDSDELCATEFLTYFRY